MPVIERPNTKINKREEKKHEKKISNDLVKSTVHHHQPFVSMLCEAAAAAEEHIMDIKDPV